eukprot:270302-Hanusia_phi.AAC.1
MPDSTCFLLAGFSLLQSAFPIYYSYAWANIAPNDTNETLQNTSLYKVFSTYVGVLWLLVAVNIFAPLIGIGDDKYQRNFPRTIAFVLNLLGSLTIMILGIWMIAAVFPTTACVDLGLKAASSKWACTAYHIISWMHFIILCLLALLVICIPCLLGYLKRLLLSMLDTAGGRSICPDDIIEWLRKLLSPAKSPPKFVEPKQPVPILQPVFTMTPIVTPVVTPIVNPVTSVSVVTPVVTSPGIQSIQPVASYQPPPLYVSSIQ